MNLDFSGISNREKRILLMVFGILLMVLSYALVFHPQMERSSELAAQNQGLNSRLDELLSMAAKKEYYKKETQNMQEETDRYCEKFPADIKEEDGIVLAQNIEKATGITIDTVGTGVRLMVSEDGTVSEEADEQQQTLSDQDNAATKEQVDAIEGNTQASTETQKQTDDALVEDSPTLYRTQDIFSYKGSYENLKKAVTYINSQTGRMTVDSITMTFDAGTGGLTGTLTVDIYSMSGIGTQYHEPDAGTSIYGKKNLFGTLDY